MNNLALFKNTAINWKKSYTNTSKDMIVLVWVRWIFFPFHLFFTSATYFFHFTKSFRMVVKMTFLGFRSWNWQGMISTVSTILSRVIIELWIFWHIIKILVTSITRRKLFWHDVNFLKRKSFRSVWHPWIWFLK